MPREGKLSRDRDLYISWVKHGVNRFILSERGIGKDVLVSVVGDRQGRGQCIQYTKSGSKENEGRFG